MRRVTVMVALIATSALPAHLGAQRWPTPPRQGPAQPAPLPPQPGVVSRELAYRRLPYSVETYPLVSTFRLSEKGPAGVTHWTSGGIGTRVDYRVSRYFSATLDATSALLGGPTMTETLELGVRMHSQRGEGRFYPFADLRAGYVHMHDSYNAPITYVDPYAPPGSNGPTYSEGAGILAGVGAEYTLTTRFSLIGSASVLRGRLGTYRYGGGGPSSGDYWLTSQRYTLGVRFNPVRWLHRGAR